jgi:hypothetical protein
MIDPKVKSAIPAALTAFSEFNEFDATTITGEFYEVFESDEDFMTKVEEMDDVFDTYPAMEVLREVFFDILMVNFFSADVQKLESDYLDSPEWEAIEEETLDRGTELLNVLLYLNECEDEDIEPGLEDYLKEFLLVDEDEFQDEYRIYEPIIANQALIEGPVEDIAKVADILLVDSEIKELFYPLMCFFQNTEPTEETLKMIADSSLDPEFDMPVMQILISFK